jgi:hypothetical protein
VYFVVVVEIQNNEKCFQNIAENYVINTLVKFVKNKSLQMIIIVNVNCHNNKDDIAQQQKQAYVQMSGKH